MFVKSLKLEEWTVHHGISKMECFPSSTLFVNASQVVVCVVSFEFVLLQKESFFKHYLLFLVVIHFNSTMELQEFITSTSIIFRTGNGNDVVISKDKIGRHCNDLFNNVHESYFDDEKSKTTMKLEDEADKENRLDQGLEEDYNDETIDEMLLDFLASDTFQQQVLLN